MTYCLVDWFNDCVSSQTTGPILMHIFIRTICWSEKCLRVLFFRILLVFLLLFFSNNGNTAHIYAYVWWCPPFISLKFHASFNHHSSLHEREREAATAGRLVTDKKLHAARDVNWLTETPYDNAVVL